MHQFRDLDEKETLKFQQWARDNYTPNAQIDTLYHPVVQLECLKINTEFNGCREK